MSTSEWVMTWRSIRRALDGYVGRLTLAIGCMAVLLFGLYLQFRPQSYHACNADFHAFYNAAIAVGQGANPYAHLAAWVKSYVPGMGEMPPLLTAHAPCGEARVDYVYPPIFALLLLPFTWLPPIVAVGLWDLCNVAFFLGAIYTFLRAANIRPSTLHVLALAAAASLMSPIRTEFYTGQADMLILFLICAALWAHLADRAVIAGALLALGCVVKPPLLVVVALLIWKREWKFAAASIVGFLALLLTPFLWLGARALGDLLAIWQFWSDHYLVDFAHNYAPKAVLARLFSDNRVVSPLVVSPVLATVLWLGVAVVVALLTVAVVRSLPLQSDARSLMEVGLVVIALFLMGPMTEDNHLTLLVVPLLGLYVWLLQVEMAAPGTRAIVVMTVLLWLLLCGPLHQVQSFFWNRIRLHALMGDVYMLLSLTFLYALVALFALQLRALRVISGHSTVAAMRQLLGHSPAIARQWVVTGSAMLASAGMIGSQRQSGSER